MLSRLIKKLEEIYRYRYFARYNKGPYKFLLKKVYKSTDIDFLEYVWQMDYFREVLQPVEVDLNQMKKVLVLAPHQDDEVIGCGGLLLALSDQNAQITLGFLTDGAEMSDPEGSLPIRKAEAIKVSERLGADIWELGINNIDLDILPAHVDRLVDLLGQGWDAVFTVWFVDQPPKHRLCSYLVARSLERSNYSGPVYQYGVHTDLLPNFYLDITSSIDEKQELIRLYSSQLAVQRYDHLSRGMDAWRSRFLPVSSKARYIETFMQTPCFEYIELVQLYKKIHPGKLFKGNERCVREFERIKKL